MVWTQRDKDGAARIELTECPSRALTLLPWAEELVTWWLQSSQFGEMSGTPLGPPEWPRPGGYLRQPAQLVDAVAILRSEWPHVLRGSAKA